MSDRAFKALLFTTGAVFLAMVFLVSLRDCGGVWPVCSFDAQILPYSPQAARAYLAAIGPEGVSTYLWRLQPLDMIFPAALCLSLREAFDRYAPERIAHGLTRLAVITAGIDYLENAVIRVMLKQADGGFSDFVANGASGLTSLKWAALALCFGALGGVIFRYRRR